MKTVKTVIKKYVIKKEIASRITESLENIKYDTYKYSSEKLRTVRFQIVCCIEDITELFFTINTNNTLKKLLINIINDVLSDAPLLYGKYKFSSLINKDEVNLIVNHVFDSINTCSSKSICSLCVKKTNCNKKHEKVCNNYEFVYIDMKDIYEKIKKRKVYPSVRSKKNDNNKQVKS